ncbi:hypothetical protein [Roseomonas sp. BN140053]|uniref:hypothetical protein n=1 Tax=Roseomonas sp. BN140053 TaxID=3391898 RepID=UPI0039E79F12
MSALMDPRTADKLAKVAGLLASDQDGERAAAAWQASRLLTSCGWSWAELVERATTPTPIPQSRPQPNPSAYSYAYPGGAPDHVAAARRALMSAHLLTPWEAAFCNSIAGQRRGLSTKQRTTLDAITAKLRQAGAA